MVLRARISTPRGPRMTLTRIGFCENGTFRNGFGAERRQGPTRGHRILNTSVPVSFRSCCFARSGLVPVFRAWARNAFPVRSGLRVPVVSGPGVFRSVPVLVFGPCSRCLAASLFLYLLHKHPAGLRLLSVFLFCPIRFYTGFYGSPYRNLFALPSP